jgi:hypothetical protein
MSIVCEIKSFEKVRYGQPLPNKSESVKGASNYKMHKGRMKGIS